MTGSTAPLLIDEKAVDACFGPAEAVAAVEDALTGLADGEIRNGLRVRTELGGVTVNSMAAASTRMGRACVKLYPVVTAAHRTQATELHVSLYDLRTGRLIAVTSADLLTRRRTAAASVVGIRRLGWHPRRMAIIGTGKVASAHVESCLASLPELESIAIAGRTPQQAAELVESVDRTGLVSAGEIAEVVRAADVVILATSSATPVIDASWLRPSTLLIATGSNRFDARELGADVIERCERIVVDELATARVESGDLIANAVEWDRVEELPRRHGRQAPGEGVVLFESHGLAAFDLTASAHVYDRTREGMA